VAYLLANSGGRDDQVDANTEEDNNETSPGDEASLTELVGITALRPDIRGVDGGVAIDIGAILVGELVYTVALQRKRNMKGRRVSSANNLSEMMRARGT